VLNPSIVSEIGERSKEVELPTNLRLSILPVNQKRKEISLSSCNCSILVPKIGEIEIILINTE
jgi:hypothetical protein